MKKYKVVILAIMVMALSLCTYWLVKDTPKEVSEEYFSEETFVVKKVMGDISSITLKNSEGVFAFEKSNGIWMNVFTEKVETTGNTINALESIAKETLAIDKIEENATAMNKYGLDTPAATLEYKTSSGESGFLKIGNSIIGTKYYFTVDNFNVYTMDVSEAGLFMVGMGAFADLSLTDVKIENIKKITIVKDSEEIIVEKKNQSELTEEKASALFTYALRSPVKENASPEDVQALFELVANVGASGYNPYADDEECGFTESVRYFSYEAGNVKQKFILGNSAGKGYTYLKKEGVSGAYKVSDDVIRFMDYTAFDLVDKHITLFYFEEVSGITIDASGEKFEMEIGDNVTVNGKEIAVEDAQEFFRNIISLSYDGSIDSGNAANGADDAVDEDSEEVMPIEGNCEVSIEFELKDGRDKTEYIAYDAMYYAVKRNGAKEFIIQRKFVEKIISLIKEL